MRKMMTLASAAALLILTAGVFAPGGTLSAGEDADLEKMIASAKTAADHEAIAAQYEHVAEEAKAKSEKHHDMGEVYKKAGGYLIVKQHIDAHCNSLANLYKKVAKENEVLAKAHHAMAKTAK